MKLLTKQNIGNRTIWLILILISIQIANAVSTFSDVPPPPPRPAEFRNREELKRYLQLVHEYYTIIGRPRFGRSQTERLSSLSDLRPFNCLDIDDDPSIAYNQVHERLENE